MAKRKSAREAPVVRAWTHIKDLTPDRRNARTHTPKNIGMLTDSLRAVGAGRSIVIDEDGEILAGNGLCEAAAEAGITKLQVVDADGDTVIAVRRTGLTPEQKTALALYDNQTATLAEWNVDVLKELAAGGFDLAPFEFDAAMLKEIGAPDDVANQAVPGTFLVVITCSGEPQQVQLLDRFLAEGLTCKALVS